MDLGRGKLVYHLDILETMGQSKLVQRLTGQFLLAGWRCLSGKCRELF